MNEELYEIAKKHLENLEVKNIMDIEVRHVTSNVDEDGLQEKNIQIDIYYK